jgi:bcr-type benzoyl-CoA reductase subunit C
MSGVEGGLTAILSDPYASARQAKQGGRKVVGVTPMHFPEELVHAAGALPVVLQESSEPVTVGFGHIYPFYCGFMRSTVDLAVKGKLDHFDAIVVSDMCYQTRMMSHIMRVNMRKTPFVYIQWPLESNTERWLAETVGKLGKVRERLEQALDVEISDQAIAESVAVYNENRALLRRLFGLRRQKPGVLRSKEVVAAVMSSMVMPIEESNALVRRLIGRLEEADTPAKPGVPLFLSGHLCQAVKPDILDLVEDLGGVVVDDDLYTGFRYVATDTPTNIPPIEALARRYLELALPCPSRSDRRDWASYLVEASRASKAQGVVALVVKFCEAHMIYYPFLKDKFTEAGLPHLLLETEHEVVSMEGIRTRLQAFIEMLRSGRLVA